MVGRVALFFVPVELFLLPQSHIIITTRVSIQAKCPFFIKMNLPFIGFGAFIIENYFLPLHCSRIKLLGTIYHSAASNKIINPLSKIGKKLSSSGASNHLQPVPRIQAGS
jgi:hypothetical protein